MSAAKKRKGSESFGTPFPAVEPTEKGHLAVSDLHSLYYEVVGNPKGKPVCFLHGGPGAGISELHRRLFDPAHYRIILHEQRGTNRSTPKGCLENNTTWDLVSDIEKLREHFGIDDWILFGGSWGSTLAILYAETHPTRVKAMVLRGIWLNRQAEMNWLYQEGANRIYPDMWENFVAPVPEEQRHDMIKAYHNILTGTDEEAKIAAGRAWAQWETATYRMVSSPEEVRRDGEDPYSQVISAIEVHYFAHKSWLRCDNQLLEDIHKIAHIPCTIVQGRHDTVCPPISAYQLHKAYPASELRIVIGGHATDEPAIMSELILAMERYKSL